MKKLFGIVVLVLTLAIAPAQAVTVWYQPTPYPSNITTGIHIWDGWLGSNYNTTFVRDDKLQIGGWGDLYRAYFKFDLAGLPPSVSQAAIWFYPYPRGDSSTPIDVNFYLVTSSWSTGMTWGAQPSATLMGWKAAPVANQWWGTNITSWYNNWKNGSPNYGMRLDPRTTPWNNFDVFRSSRYTANDGARPILQLDFTPPITVPGFKIPLPGNLAWLVTTEVGGWDCKGLYDAAHDGANYFSIDFSWRNKDLNGNPKYTSPNNNIPVIAAAGGTVQTFPNAPYNGNYVVITHGTTGFTTRYVHMKSFASGINGATVAQGDLLGYMGTTGTDPNTGKPTSTGVHLHFGVRYNNSGTEATNVRYAVMDGWILKSFQTECQGGDWIRYYTSSNRVY